MKSMVKVRNDLTGEQFGLLKVIKQAEDYVDPKGTHRARWECECQCHEHNIVFVTTGNLTSGEVASCGCMKRNNTGKARVQIEMIGKEFGKLTVLEQIPDLIEPSGKHWDMWRCVCSCVDKTEVNVRGTLLRTGQTKSCGCLKKGAHKQYNNYDLSGAYGVGLTSNTNKEFYFDLEDYDKIKDICWCESIDNGFSKLIGYDTKNNKRVRMHAYLGYSRYDHIDRNQLNNRKCNLRKCTQQENSMNRGLQSNNTSGFTGVCFNKQNQKWYAQLQVTISGEKKHFQGTLRANFEDAKIDRLKLEAKYFGKFAPHIDLFEQYGITIQNELEKNNA